LQKGRLPAHYVRVESLAELMLGECQPRESNQKPPYCHVPQECYKSREVYFHPIEFF